MQLLANFGACIILVLLWFFRLGSGAEGAQDLKRHEFFATIDFDDLFAKKIKPPFQPVVCSREDEYFDEEYTCKTPKDSPGIPVSADTHELFKG